MSPSATLVPWGTGCLCVRGCLGPQTHSAPVPARGGRRAGCGFHTPSGAEYPLGNALEAATRLVVNDPDSALRGSLEDGIA